MTTAGLPGQRFGNLVARANADVRTVGSWIDVFCCGGYRAGRDDTACGARGWVPTGALVGKRSQGMTRYLISFDDGAMSFPDEDLPDVADAAHAVVKEAQDAGVWVFGGGVESQRASVVAMDGTVADGPYPEIKSVVGGFAIVDVASREQAHVWAAKFASACRCAQEVREIMPDPSV